MPNIKIKKKGIEKIKKLDKAKIYTQRLKNDMVFVKDKTHYNSKEENTPTEDSANRITENTEIIIRKSANKFDQYVKKSIKESKTNLMKAKAQISNIKRKAIQKSVKKKNAQVINNHFKNRKAISKTIKNTNRTKRTIKTAKQTGKITYKTIKHTTKTTIKGAKKAYQITKATIKLTAKNIKLAIKATISSIKAILAATKALIAFIIAGGWGAIMIIIVISLIALLCSSFMGIFFSSEQNGNNRPMNSVISEINSEFITKITDIQNNTIHDEFEIHSNRAEWRDVLSIYVPMVTNGEDGANLVLLDDNNISILKRVFWEMNIVSSRVELVDRDIEVTDEKGNVKIQKVKRKLLIIDVTGKSIQEMIDYYHFNSNQIKQIDELQKEEYKELWAKVIYGGNGSSDIVRVALSQVGNVGGQTYWSWYGFPNRVEWCAIFVSWCANQCGYIEAGIIPKFASCESEGVAWFQTCDLWKDRGYIPKARRYYIFRLGK